MPDSDLGFRNSRRRSMVSGRLEIRNGKDVRWREVWMVGARIEESGTHPACPLGDDREHTEHSLLSSVRQRTRGTGYLSVSIDLPWHGSQTGDRRPSGLSGWGELDRKDVDFMAPFNDRLSEVLDHLIQTENADPEKIAICGTSRGGSLEMRDCHDSGRNARSPAG